MPIGAHMSIAGSLHLAFERMLTVGGECLQIFVKASTQWAARELTEEEIILFRKTQKQSGIRPVVAHASYLLNLASPDEALWKKSIKTLVLEITRCALLNIGHIIFHPGSHRGSGEKTGIQRIASALNLVLEQTTPLDVKILLETTSGAGDQMGYRLEHLRDILGLSQTPGRLGICVDTSHIFAAGYDLGSPEGYDNFFRSLIQLIGLKKLMALHLNDSKSPLGSRVDRHAHIGHGHLGLKPFQWLMEDKKLRTLPMILETPKGKKGGEDWDAVTINLLKKMRGDEGLLAKPSTQDG